MVDVFISYASKDLDRVKPIRDALAGQGFEIFLDQSMPSGVDWDTWIRQDLSRAKCVIVLWTANSVESVNVRHEAKVAQQQGKLIPVLLQPLEPQELPMGHYTTQCANLAGWSGDAADADWRKLQSEIETKLTPPWVHRQLQEASAALFAEQARREAVEMRDRALQGQITKEVQARHELKQELDRVSEESVAAKRQIDEMHQRLSAAEHQQRGLIEDRTRIQAKAAQDLKVARDSAAADAAVAKQQIEEIHGRLSLAKHEQRGLIEEIDRLKRRTAVPAGYVSLEKLKNELDAIPVPKHDHAHPAGFIYLVPVLSGLIFWVVNSWVKPNWSDWTEHVLSWIGVISSVGVGLALALFGAVNILSEKNSVITALTKQIDIVKNKMP